MYFHVLPVVSFLTLALLYCALRQYKKTHLFLVHHRLKLNSSHPYRCSFFRSGIQTKIALFIHSIMSVYGKIKSEVIKIISDVYALLFACPGLGCYFWRLINNLTQPVGGTEWDDISQPFTSFYLFRASTSLFEIVEFFLDVKTLYSCC